MGEPFNDPTAKKVKGTKTANPPLPKEIVTYRRIHTYVAKKTIETNGYE